MTAAAPVSESAAKWAEALTAAAEGRTGDARIAAIWAGLAACDEGIPLDFPPAGDEWLVICWRQGWQSQHRANADAASLAGPAPRLPYAED